MSAAKRRVAVVVVVLVVVAVFASLIASLELSSTPTSTDSTDSSSTNVAIPRFVERDRPRGEGSSAGERSWSEDPSGEPDAGGERPEDQARRVLCDPRARILCEASLGCGCIGDLEACVERRSRECVAFHDGERADEGLAATCLSIYAANAHLCVPRIHCPHVALPVELGDECGGYPGYRYSCARGQGWCKRGLCVPVARLGDACADFRDCSVDASCRRGICVAWDREGTPCEVDRECGPTLACLDGACALQRGDGEPCERAVDCLPMHRCDEGVCRAASQCARDADCGPRAGCVGGEAEAQVCVPARSIGEPCWSGEECASGLGCARRGECAPLPGVGELCLELGHCADGLACVGERCERAPSEGEPCNPEWTRAVCGTGLRCVVDGEDEVCRRHGGVGELCATHRACVAHSRCERGRCVVAAETCEQNQDCPPEHVCVDGSCRALRRLGERGCDTVPCASDARCLDDRCVPLPTSGATCDGPCADGAICEVTHRGGRCVAVACSAMFR